MLIKVNDKEFDLNTKLGTTFKIEERFKKPYLRVITSIDEMKAKDQLDLLACGLSNQDDIKELKEAFYEEGVGQIMEVLEQFIDGLQYPGLTEEEITEKKLAKVAKQKKMKALGLID